MKLYVCQACGAQHEAFSPSCKGCGKFNTVIEETLSARDGETREDYNRRPLVKLDARELKDVSEIQGEELERIMLGIDEFDRVLGGGAVPGGVTLVAGPPGSGKSSLLLQALGSLAALGGRALYVSGEEDLGQIGMRAQRFGIEEGVKLISTDNLDKALTAILHCDPAVVVFDSVQTIGAKELESATGTVSQLKEVTSQIVRMSKDSGVISFIVGHVTKEGGVAGPKVLEHLVDTVLEFESESGHSLRTLRASKNRFGSTSEVGIFEMTDAGMKEVASPSEMMLLDRADVPGSVVVSTCSGTRPLLANVQALVNLRDGEGKKTEPKRIARGFESGRLGMLLAVLRDVVPGSADVYVNVKGGVRIDDPGLDLGVALALVSSVLERPCRRDAIVFGEIGLNGEISAVGRAESRLAEARALGFRRAIVPRSTRVGEEGNGGIEIVRVASVLEAVDAALVGAGAGAGVRARTESVGRGRTTRKKGKRAT